VKSTSPSRQSSLTSLSMKSGSSRRKSTSSKLARPSPAQSLQPTSHPSGQQSPQPPKSLKQSTKLPQSQSCLPEVQSSPVLFPQPPSLPWRKSTHPKDKSTQRSSSRKNVRKKRRKPLKPPQQLHLLLTLLPPERPTLPMLLLCHPSNSHRVQMLNKDQARA